MILLAVTMNLYYLWQLGEKVEHHWLLIRKIAKLPMFPFPLQLTGGLAPNIQYRYLIRKIVRKIIFLTTFAFPFSLSISIKVRLDRKNLNPSDQGTYVKKRIKTSSNMLKFYKFLRGGAIAVFSFSEWINDT